MHSGKKYKNMVSCLHIVIFFQAVTCTTHIFIRPYYFENSFEESNILVYTYLFVYAKIFDSLKLFSNILSVV